MFDVDNIKSFTHVFDLTNGLSPTKKPLQRRLSQMRGMFLDTDAQEEMIRQEDPLVYEFYDMGMPEEAEELAFGTSITYPGKVGDEFFMTKGHFHTILETAEVYFCLKGHGVMLMENPEGEWEAQELTPGTAVYVPGRYAHRSINISLEEPFISFFAFRADAGHEYGTIETKGMRKLIVEKNRKPEIVDNPRWQE